MKVNPNDRVIDYEIQESGGGIAAGPVSNIPIRLEIASRILAGCYEKFKSEFEEYWDGKMKDHQVVERALDLADALIKAHNQTSGGGEG